MKNHDCNNPDALYCGYKDCDGANEIRLLTLESRLKWAEDLLERAKPFLEQLVKDYAKNETKVEQKILADLASGPDAITKGKEECS